MSNAKKNYYYVLVVTTSGPKFVTSVHHKDKMAEWNEEESPKELGKYLAEDITMGLNFNGHLAYTVHMPFEIENHPYRYDRAHIVWEDNKEDNKEDLEKED